MNTTITDDKYKQAMEAFERFERRVKLEIVRDKDDLIKLPPKNVWSDVSNELVCKGNMKIMNIGESDGAQEAILHFGSGTFTCRHYHTDMREEFMIIQGCVSYATYEDAASKVPLTEGTLYRGDKLKIETREWHTVFNIDKEAYVLTRFILAD